MKIRGRFKPLSDWLPNELLKPQSITLRAEPIRWQFLNSNSKSETNSEKKQWSSNWGAQFHAARYIERQIAVETQIKRRELHPWRCGVSDQTIREREREKWREEEREEEVFEVELEELELRLASRIWAAEGEKNSAKQTARGIWERESCSRL